MSSVLYLSLIVPYKVRPQVGFSFEVSISFLMSILSMCPSFELTTKRSLQNDLLLNKEEKGKEPL